MISVLNRTQEHCLVQMISYHCTVLPGGKPCLEHSPAMHRLTTQPVLMQAPAHAVGTHTQYLPGSMIEARQHDTIQVQHKRNSTLNAQTIQQPSPKHGPAKSDYTVYYVLAI